MKVVVIVAMLRSETDGPSIYGVYVDATEAKRRLASGGWVVNERRSTREQAILDRGMSDPYGGGEYLVLGRFEVQGPTIQVDRPTDFVREAGRYLP